MLWNKSLRQVLSNLHLDWEELCSVCWNMYSELETKKELTSILSQELLQWKFPFYHYKMI